MSTGPALANTCPASLFPNWAMGNVSPCDQLGPPWLGATLDHSSVSPGHGDLLGLTTLVNIPPSAVGRREKA